MSVLPHYLECHILNGRATSSMWLSKPVRSASVWLSHPTSCAWMLGQTHSFPHSGSRRMSVSTSQSSP